MNITMIEVQSNLLKKNLDAVNLILYNINKINIYFIYY